MSWLTTERHGGIGRAFERGTRRNEEAVANRLLI